jgi:hypothetical protein
VFFSVLQHDSVVDYSYSKGRSKNTRKRSTIYFQDTGSLHRFAAVCLRQTHDDFLGQTGEDGEDDEEDKEDKEPLRHSRHKVTVLAVFALFL